LVALEFRCLGCLAGPKSRYREQEGYGYVRALFAASIADLCDGSLRPHRAAFNNPRQPVLHRLVIASPPHPLLELACRPTAKPPVGERANRLAQSLRDPLYAMLHRLSKHPYSLSGSWAPPRTPEDTRPGTIVGCRQRVSDGDANRVQRGHAVPSPE
jgi:hypothetical protein